jgi:hypothetical protein
MCGVIALAVIAALTALSPARAADPRNRFVLDGIVGYYQYQGNGDWARYLNGRLDRMYKETNRTDDFIEMEGKDDNGNPVLDRIYNKEVQWKLKRADRWNHARTGGWVAGRR